jgi:hypothetical protein
MNDFPDWTPEFVRPLLTSLGRNRASRAARRIAFELLLNDRRMQPVYNQFLRRDRKSGDFLYPAKLRKRNQSLEMAQLAALREVLCVVINAAGDRISVSKLEQLHRANQRWGTLATQLRELAHDMHSALEFGLLGFDDRKSKALGARDGIALLHVANWLDHQISALRRPGDPLIVKRLRGDPVARGVQIMISIKMKEQFGDRLDGTAATLTSIALATAATPRISRSALAKRKAPKKRTAR